MTILRLVIFVLLLAQIRRQGADMMESDEEGGGGHSDSMFLTWRKLKLTTVLTPVLTT